jgi:hypothetical protein
MSHCSRLSVRLRLGQRFFRCPYCLLLAEHPPVFLDYLLDGHAFCDQCGQWAVIENYRTFASKEEFEAARNKAKGKR